jgi:DNA replication and repair protein RecF
LPLVRDLFVEKLSIRGFRNLAEVELELGAGFVVISGDNGQGKTNLLEAVYALATSKSFRANKPGELIRHGDELASLRATVTSGGDRREQSLGLQEGARRVKLDGKSPATLSAYAVATPVVVFHPGEISLSMGGGSDRRKLLDRTSLYLAPASAQEVERYTRALRERQRALGERGPGATDASEWEELLVRHGVEVHRRRAESARRLGDAAEEAFRKIGATGLHLSVSYSPGSPLDPVEFRAALANSRLGDARRGTASVGPHRDDLSLALDDRPVRGFASQGQHRTIVLALKAAEVEVIARARELRPLLLLDDVSSELDRGRTSALFAYLEGQEGQVFLTTTRPELIEIRGTGRAPRRDFAVRGGVIREA